jgi:hypothetical protein
LTGERVGMLPPQCIKHCRVEPLSNSAISELDRRSIDRPTAGVEASADQGQVLPAARQRGRFAGKDWDIADPQADRELDLSEPEQLTFQYRSEIEQLRSLPIRTAAETDSSRSIVGPHSSFLVANL